MTNEPSMIDILVNGETLSISEGSSISDLLRQLEIGGRAIAVEVNQQLQPSGSFDTHVLRQGDSLEVVTLVGGG